MVQAFENVIKRINTFLKLIGMSIEREDSDRTTLQRLKYHWPCSIHLFVLNYSIIGQIIWLVVGITTGKSLLQITYLLPCVTLCMLGNFKLCFFIHNAQHVNNVIDKLTIMENLKLSGKEITEDKLRKKWLQFLMNVFNLIFILNVIGLVAFAVGPIIIMASFYYTSGEIKLFLPFIVWYPFNEFDIRFWPFVYTQQLCSACMCVLSVYGPDCFFFACCTFIHLHFVNLQHDMEQIVKEDLWQLPHNIRYETFKTEFVQLVNRHRELIRCVELVNIVYSKSTLFNVATSSLIICAAGFNLMAIKNYALMFPFCSFLSYGFFQVFCYCYYGDYVMRSSAGVGDAIYNSRWYDVGALERKCLIIALVRSQKPCKFTAYGFMDINLSAFTGILSTSWSYFALLNQKYQN